MARIDEPLSNIEFLTHQQRVERNSANVRDALAKAETRIQARGSLGTRRAREAAEYTRRIFRELSASPALKTGRTLEPGELETFVSDYMAEQQGIPASMRASMRDTATKIVRMVADGDRQNADQLARSAAVDFGDKLASSTWAGPPEDDFDPRAIAARISR